MSGHNSTHNEFLADKDRLSEAGFFAALEGIAVKAVQNVLLLQTVDSTNTRAKNEAKNGAPHGTVVIAETQTAGKGRLGRSFYSPAQSGLYMSILFRLPSKNYQRRFSEVPYNFIPAEPITPVFNPALFTAAAAVAVTRALQSVCGIDTRIKWVNDIYCNGKKLCGILAEGVTGSSSKIPDFIVIGIGVNVFSHTFPQELHEKAASVCDSSLEPAKKMLSFTRNQLAAKITSTLFALLTDETADFMKEYRQKSCVIGKEIAVIDGQKTYRARAISIDENGCLLIETPDGKQQTLNSGDVSIRGEF